MKFIFDYKRSKFLECNKTLFETNLKRIGDSHKPNVERDSKIIQTVLNIKSYFDDIMINYWISDGSMLGVFLILIVKFIKNKVLINIFSFQRMV